MADTPIRVLLIEDDQNDALILLRLLAGPELPSFRFVCRCAQSLAEGFEEFSKEDADVILLDLTLPDSRGMETLRRLRERAPDSPVVVLTGLSDESLGLEAVAQGAQDYLVKGKADARDIKKAIGYAVERYRSGAQLQGIFKNSADGMIILSTKGTVLYMNPAAEAIFNIKSSEFLGKSFLYAIPAHSPAELRIPNKTVGGPDSIVEFHLSDIQWRGAPARLALARDVTGSRILEQLRADIAERFQMDKLKDELLSSVSHEMRIPLTIVRTSVGLFKEGAGGTLTRKQEELVGLLDRGSARLQKILENILDLSRLESGKAMFNPSEMSVVAVIRDVAGDFRILARDCGVDIQEEISGDLPSVYADPESLKKILSNLIENAMRFTEKKILVRAFPVSAEVGNRYGHRASDQALFVLPQGGYVQISVIDDGPGIPRASQEKLFSKFQQASRDPKRGEYKGTGLGLALCKESVELQGGKIWVESEEGRGSAFHFVLPQFKEKQNKEARLAFPSPSTGSIPLSD